MSPAAGDGLRAVRENIMTSTRAAQALLAQELEDFYLTFSTEQGQRVLRWIEAHSFQVKTTFEAPAPGAAVDPKLSDRNEGRRILGLEILNRYKISTQKRTLEGGGRAQGTLSHDRSVP